MTDRDRAPVWGMAESRVALVVVGVGLAIVGVVVFASDVRPSQYPAIAAWLIGALIVHDVLIAGTIVAVAVLSRRAPVPYGAVLVVQGALAVAGITALVVVPEIVKKAIGTANPTILPLDYGLNLAVLLGVLTIAAGVGVLLHLRLARRATAQD
ncbi:hypothetical protein GCM10022200_10100 [Microbacterium awajiense]|uniref:Uncharacterized protein n=1 Tax=Microbacterium awajiense TaxID=415214 RepID=A0ABP7ACK8_9MICO